VTNILRINAMAVAHLILSLQHYSRRLVHK
jgi:hypothetical protein